MRKSSMVFEVTDGEIRGFCFSIPLFRKLVHNSSVVKFDRIPIPTGIIEQGIVRDENSLIGILSTYRSQHPGNCQKAHLAVSLQQGFIGSYTLPWLSKYDRKSAIPLLVDEEISIARSDLLYDFLVISEEKHKGLQVLLGATRRSILEQYAFIFGQAGFSVSGADFAYSVLGQALGFEADKDVLYLQGDSGSIHMALFRGVVPKSVRSLPSLLSKDASANEGREQGRIDEWKNEVGRFLLYHRTQQPDYNLKRLVWSGGPEIAQLAQALAASNHNLMVEQAMLKDIPDSWQKLLEDNKGFAEVTMGYGQRIFSDRSGLNLWCQPVAKQKVKKTYLGLVFLAAVFLIAGTLIWLSLCQRALNLQEEITQLSTEGAGIEEQNRQQGALTSAWNKVSIHSEKIGERLAQVQELEGAELKIEQIIFKQGSLSVHGSANDSKSVQGIINSLRALGWEAPSLSSYKLTALKNVEFILNAKQGGNYD
ncbi:competence protein ComA [Desulfosporosinus nitroreducens]|uniref:competence protein ComA n=1 Tax=Desulfosporosinus nitroreducens TaxID=2018668 RepID=UPI00207C13C0|nr:competence protein ComA [Desulfosporosinus nitroreducens]MCO1600068.1 competence protein ComA [Desulfosporosinus nitroreducens]